MFLNIECKTLQKHWQETKTVGFYHILYSYHTNASVFP